MKTCTTCDELKAELAFPSDHAFELAGQDITERREEVAEFRAAQIREGRLMIGRREYAT